MFNFGAFGSTLAEKQSTVEDAGRNAGTGGVGDVGKKESVKGETAEVDALEFMWREVGGDGKVHQVEVASSLRWGDLRIREFEGPVNKF